MAVRTVVRKGQEQLHACQLSLMASGHGLDDAQNEQGGEMNAPEWTKLTDYQQCACCGQELSGMIQETIPGRKRILVTCENPNCHEKVYGQTLSPHVHYALCYTVNMAVKS
jgi:hypothetical protein